MEFEFTSAIIEWRGPAPYLFAEIPESFTEELKIIAQGASYGWGVIPCQVTIGETTNTTSLIPRNGRYLLPVKLAFQKGEDIELGDEITASISIDQQDRYQSTQ